MGKIIVFLLIVFLAVTIAQAQELKPGFVNDTSILGKLTERQEVQKILDKEAALWEQRFSDRRKIIKVYLDSVNTAQSALNTARASLEADSAKAPVSTADQAPAAASVAAEADSAGAAAGVKTAATVAGQAGDTLKLHNELKRLEKTLEKEKKEIVAFYHQIYGRDGILKRRNAELSQSILEKINRSIKETSQTLGITLMFDSSVLLYLDQDYNFTDQVMQALNLEPQRTR